MTPKEKARELVDKYADKAGQRTDWDYDIQCALICVDEILESYNTLIYYPEDLKEYWNEIKQEINKL